MAKKKKTKKQPLTYFSAENYISFKLVKGKHVIDLGAPALKGKSFAVYIKLKSETTNSTWSIDLVANDYKQTRTIPNEVSTSWHHVPSCSLDITDTKLIISNTSNDKEITGLAEIKIIN